MNSKLAWAHRLIAVISPDYVPSRYSPMEWASQIWNDPDGTWGSVIPVIVSRPRHQDTPASGNKKAPAKVNQITHDTALSRESCIIMARGPSLCGNQRG